MERGERGKGGGPDPTQGEIWSVGDKTDLMEFRL